MKLSPRQAQIAGMIADGNSYDEIAGLLGIQNATVNLIALQARRKMKARSNAAMSAMIWRKRLAAEKKTYNNDRISAT